MAERELVSRERLVEIMNGELAKHGACEDCQIADHILPLQEPGETGCNWSDNVILRCSGRSITYACCRAVVGVVEAARRHYNLAEP